MPHTVIAVVSDCDETLAPDTTAQLLSHFGIDAKKFYKDQSGKLVDEGFDPPLAYMNEILRMAQGREVNTPMEQSERRVPIKNMIYLGDGPSDIRACLLFKRWGKAMGPW